MERGKTENKGAAEKRESWGGKGEMKEKGDEEGKGER